MRGRTEDLGSGGLSRTLSALERIKGHRRSLEDETFRNTDTISKKKLLVDRKLWTKMN